jgi:hypothetical protein
MSKQLCNFVWILLNQEDLWGLVFYGWCKVCMRKFVRLQKTNNHTSSAYVPNHFFLYINLQEGRRTTFQVPWHSYQAPATSLQWTLASIFPEKRHFIYAKWTIHTLRSPLSYFFTCFITPSVKTNFLSVGFSSIQVHYFLALLQKDWKGEILKLV